MRPMVKKLLLSISSRIFCVLLEWRQLLDE